MQFLLDTLTFRYAKKNGFILGPLSLSIDTGAVTALIGSNGSGKTTLIKVLINEYIGYEGAYFIDEVPVKDMTGSMLHRFDIGYAPEFPVLEERLTGMEIMYLLKEVHAINDEQFNLQVNGGKKALNCSDWFEKTPCSECSQGMRKKISLMIAFTGDPAFLIIDEPTNGLDPLATFGLKKMLSRRAENGKGALVSSHMLDFVERVARDVLILKNGGTVFAGTVENLLAAYPEKQLDEIYYTLFMNGGGETVE